MSEEKPLAEWQKRALPRIEKCLKQVDENPEKFGTTRTHINEINKKVGKNGR
jgi:hypothetical protein